MSVKTYPMLINGQTVFAEKSIDVIDPSTGQVIGQVPEADADSIQHALKSAQQGFKVWASTRPANRKQAILRYADLLEKNSERIISLLIAETGKPQDNAEYDFDMLTTCLRYFVEEIERLDQPVLHDPDGRFLHYIQRQPLFRTRIGLRGVCPMRQRAGGIGSNGATDY